MVTGSALDKYPLPYPEIHGPFLRNWTARAFPKFVYYAVCLWNSYQSLAFDVRRGIIDLFTAYESGFNFGMLYIDSGKADFLRKISYL